MNFIYIVIAAIIALLLVFSRKKHSTTPKSQYSGFKPSEFRYTVYQCPVHEKSGVLIFILEGNKIDELGYQIYKSYTADLDKIDILIRNNQTGELMKVVIGGDSESMIGVSHPEHGHIGYLQFEVVIPDSNT